MRRLLTDIDRSFDLDFRVHGTRLGDLLEEVFERIEVADDPNWGSDGPVDLRRSKEGRSFDFFYSPHLFPEMETNLRLAHKLQFYMLPREVPDDAPMSIAGVLESYCHLSGDLFGWEMLSDGRFLIWIVDISGHGVESGIASAVLRLLVSKLRRRSDVGSLACELNDGFASSIKPCSGHLFATAFFLVVDADGTAEFTSAGHPPMLLRRADGTIEELSSNGRPLGMFAGGEYPGASVSLQDGDTLLLFTDGVLETVDDRGEFFGPRRLREFLSGSFESPRRLTDRLYREIADYQDMAKLGDDVTFVAARMHSARPGGARDAG